MKILRNILAVIAGFIVGSIVNMGIVITGHKLMPIEGVDPNDMEALGAAMPNLSWEYFAFPFLAHALGTLVGALAAALIAASNKMTFALTIGIFFLLGGIYMVTLLPSPMWFNITDIALAYIPMAWIGGKIGMGISRK